MSDIIAGLQANLASAEWWVRWICIVVGYIIIIIELDRLFNEPRYAEDPGGDRPKFGMIFTLGPSEVRRYRASMLSEVFYVLFFLGWYSLFIFNRGFHEAAGQVLATIGGRVTDGADAPVIDFGDKKDFVFDNPFLPLILALALPTLMRLKWVDRVEFRIRGFFHWMFGIPGVTKKATSRIQREIVDLRAIESDLSGQENVPIYHERLDRYVEHGLAVLGSDFNQVTFRRKVSKIFAFQIWVGDYQAWPSEKVRDRFWFADAKKDLVKDIAAFRKELELLSNRRIADPETEAGAATQSGEAADVRDSAESLELLKELWKVRQDQAEALENRVCVAIALFDQHSELPDGDDAASRSLRVFLERVRYGGASRSRIASLAVGVIFCCLLIATIAGTWFAREYNNAVIPSLPPAPEGRPYPVYTGWTEAWAWSLNALLIFGLPAWMALRYRQRRLSAESGSSWVGFYQWKKWPPLEMWLLLFAKLAVAVFLVVFAYRMATTFEFSGSTAAQVVGATPPQQNLWLGSDNLWTQFYYSMPFALAAAIHAMFLVAIADMGQRELSGLTGKVLPVLHVAVMAAAGYFTSVFLVDFAGDSKTLLPLRQMIFMAEFAGIAFLCGLIVWVFTRSMLGEEEQERLAREREKTLEKEAMA